MTEKVPAEGSIWKLVGLDLTEGEFAAKTNAIKATHVAGEIWRVYFAKDETPTLQQLARTSGATAAECVVGPDHVALVTPTPRGA